ncbi:MAG: hypothetical protein OEV64_14125 [Desulfobulbaceae bacterium]|nr:hypothetical protein [Desulfobulbaceae bacterium]
MHTQYSGVASSVNHHDAPTPDHHHISSKIYSTHANSHSSLPESDNTPPNVLSSKGFQGSPARLSSEPRVVSNIDTLKLSLYIDWSSEIFLDQVQSAKQTAQDKDQECVPVNFGGFDWNVMRSGAHSYNFRLISGDIRLLLSRRQVTADSNFPNAILEIGSMSCWSPGYRFIHDEIIRMIERLGGAICKEIVSEVHLCADSIGQNLKALPCTDQDYWITRAHKFAVFHDRRKLTGINIGKGDIMLRIYDKVEELRNESTHKQGFFAEAWGLDTYDAEDVTRLEFQLRRKVISQFQPEINTLDDLENHLATIWKYCTEEWCRLTEKPVDRNHNQSKSDTHSFWHLIKKAKWKGKNFCARVTQQLQGDIEKLLAQAAGISLSIAAYFGRQPEDIEGVVAYSQNHIEKTIRSLWRDKPDFIERMQKKINRLTDPFHVVANGMTF